MHAVIDWMMTTWVTLQLQEWATWLSPTLEIVHFIGLTILIGSAGFLDLRLLGFMKGVPVATAMEFAPWAMVGFAMNLVSGILFIGVDPSLYLASVTFWMKMLFVLVAGLNVIIFERSSLGARARTIGAGVDTTRAMKMVGATSLTAWFLVLYLGRMLPYIGTAY
jgi:hypothetical protein